MSEIEKLRLLSDSLIICDWEKNISIALGELLSEIKLLEDELKAAKETIEFYQILMDVNLTVKK